MATFNTQKGQGIFQPVLSEPGAGQGGAGRTVPGAALSVTSTGIDTAGNVLDIISSGPLPEKREDEVLPLNLADLDQALSGTVLDITSETHPVSPLQSNAKGQADRIGAAVAQGKMSQREALVRLEAVVSRFVNADPKNAETYRDFARKAIGISPADAILAERLKDIDFEKKQQREVVSTLANFAIEKGVVVADENGQIDMSATAAKGQILRQMDTENKLLDQKIARAKMLAETQKARRLTEAERDRLEFSTAMESWGPFLEEKTKGIDEALKIFRQGQAQGLSPEEVEAQLRENLALAKADISNELTQFAIQGRLSPSVRKDIEDLTLASYESMEELFTGDLSSLANAQRSLQTIEATTGRDVLRAAPALARLKSLGGDQLISSVLGAQVLADPTAKKVVNGEIRNVMIDGLEDTSNILAGSSRLSDLPANRRPQGARNLMTTVKDLSRQPQLMTDGQKQSHKTSYVELIDMLSSTNNIKDRANGVSQLSSPINLQALEALRANDGDYEAIGVAVRNLNTQAFVESVRSLNEEFVQGSVDVPEGVPVGSAVVQSARFIPVFNPETGMVEIKQENTGSGKRTQRRAPRNIRKQVEQINNYLDTVVRLKDFGGKNELAGFTPLQIKQAFVETTGAIPFKEGVEPVEIPGGLAGFFGE